MDKEFSILYKNILFNIDESLIDEYGENGIRTHLMNYVRKVSPDKIKKIDGKLFVSEELVTDEYIRKYLVKDDTNDFSAKDCAVLALVRFKAPPQEYMSIGSLEKKIREIYREQKEHVYIKRSRGKGNVACVDRRTADKILLLPEVIQLIKKQTIKAESNHDDTVEWRAYEISKAKMEYLDSLSMEDDYNGNYISLLTQDKKSNLMLEALYNSLFSAFDFEKYEKYYDEMTMLDENWDFGERYQELYGIFNSLDYKNQFYKLNPQSEFLDVLAEKIAEKILKKMQEKEG